MSELAARIRETIVPEESLAIFWIAQAGFVYKTPKGTVIYVDAYLTDCVERLYGFKRIMGNPIKPEDVEADYVVSTHAHEDHLDIDAIPVLLQNPRTIFVGAPDCLEKYRSMGVPDDRFHILREGLEYHFGDFSLTGVYADHGELAPDALGLKLCVDQICVWQVGDTAYRPEKWQGMFAAGVDVLVPPINGAFGNLNAREAALLAGQSGAKIVIPCHFWMFAEHGGNPAAFLEACQQYAPSVKPLLMTQGEVFVFTNPGTRQAN